MRPVGAPLSAGRPRPTTVALLLLELLVLLLLVLLLLVLLLLLELLWRALLLPRPTR